MTNDTSHNGLRPPKLRRAPNRSKRGWPTITGQIPPHVREQLDALSVAENKWQGDLLHEAVVLFLEHKRAA